MPPSKLSLDLIKVVVNKEVILLNRLLGAGRRPRREHLLVVLQRARL
jgi:hypothetical protein